MIDRESDLTVGDENKYFFKTSLDLHYQPVSEVWNDPKKHGIQSTLVLIGIDIRG